MSWSTIFLLLVILAILMLFSGMYICVSLAISSIFVIYITGQVKILQILSNITWNTSTDFMMTAIPLFMLMGEVLLEANLSSRFYQGLSKFMRFIPGGLLHSNIAGCGVFAAISGSSVATAAAIGGVAIPDQKKLGYFPRYVYGTLASGGTLGILIPPSIALIVYCSLTDQSVVTLFKCATIPGIILMLLYMGYVAITALIKKDRFPDDRNNAALKQLSIKDALLGIFPFAVLIFFILGSIYGGYATATEAAAIGTVMSIILGKIFGSLSLKSILRATVNAFNSTAMILFITVSAKLFSYVLTTTGATREMVSWVSSLHLSYVGMLIVVFIIYIILGCFVESTAMLFLTLPVLYPILQTYNFNFVWFGVVLVILVELGQITPPVGINLYVIKSCDVQANLIEVIKGVVPYMFIMLGYAVFLCFFPGLALLFA